MVISLVLHLMKQKYQTRQGQLIIICLEKLLRLNELALESFSMFVYIREEYFDQQHLIIQLSKWWNILLRHSIGQLFLTLNSIDFHIDGAIRFCFSLLQRNHRNLGLIIR